MTEKALYKLTRGQWLRFEPTADGGGAHKRYAPGDILANLTKAELAEHGGQLAPVSQAELDRIADVDEKLNAMLKPGKAKAAKPAAEPDEDEYEWDEVLAGSAPTIKEYINDVLSDPAMIESLMTAEMEGQNRKGVVSAANERLAQLARTPKG